MSLRLWSLGRVWNAVNSCFSLGEHTETPGSQSTGGGGGEDNVSYVHYWLTDSLIMVIFSMFRLLSKSWTSLINIQKETVYGL